jgi:hypothetical protein
MFLINLDRFVMLTSFILDSSLHTTTFSRISIYSNKVSNNSNFLLVLYHISDDKLWHVDEFQTTITEFGQKQLYSNSIPQLLTYFWQIQRDYLFLQVLYHMPTVKLPQSHEFQFKIKEFWTKAFSFVAHSSW